MDGWQVVVPENGLLKGQREKLGITQEEIAKRAGITLKQYQRYEKHNVQLSTASWKIANAILSALELDATALANGDYCFRALREDEFLRKATNSSHEE
ncbi:MAG: helix-turn-helix domain-containing protein [Firmicutes bacterium]|nr:helix-turn-helix domain-containing protein [Bacillota bacterium]